MEFFGEDHEDMDSVNIAQETLKAINFLENADKEAMLSIEGASILYNHYVLEVEAGRMNFDEEEMERLAILTTLPEYETYIFTDKQKIYMKVIIPICLFLVLSCFGCSNISGKKQVNSDSVDMLIPMEEVDSTAEMIALPDSLSPFQCVVDTLNAYGDPLVHAEYFLYDITGDGEPELWIKCGSCEADIDLWVYSFENDKVRKILSDYGRDTDFFINEDAVGSITCNTGSGYVSSYEYKNGEIKVKSAEFSAWNEEGEIKAIKKREQSFIDNVLGKESAPITFNPIK